MCVCRSLLFSCLAKDRRKEHNTEARNLPPAMITELKKKKGAFIGVARKVFHILGN